MKKNPEGREGEERQGEPSRSKGGVIFPAKRFFQRRRNWLLFAAGGAVAFTLWFVPNAFALFSERIEVSRWEKARDRYRAFAGPGTPEWVPLGQVPGHLLKALVSAEDARFYQHHGLDFQEIEKSRQVNRREGRYARGASTISQQVVKMAFLSREKSLVRKAREACGALLLEALFSKQEILEWYINLAEFGEGIYGIHEAAQSYFGVLPRHLSLQHSIHLALVLPSPSSWSKGLRRRYLTDFGRNRFQAIATRMLQSGYITRDQFRLAMLTGDFGDPIHFSGVEVEEPPQGGEASLEGSSSGPEE